MVRVPRDTRTGRAPRHAGAGLALPDPWTDLDNASGARIWWVGGGGACGRHPARGAGPEPPPQDHRDEGGDAPARDDGAVWRSGVSRLEGGWPLGCG